MKGKMIITYTGSRILCIHDKYQCHVLFKTNHVSSSIKFSGVSLRPMTTMYHFNMLAKSNLIANASCYIKECCLRVRQNINIEEHRVMNSINQGLL